MRHDGGWHVPFPCTVVQETIRYSLMARGTPSPSHDFRSRPQLMRKVLLCLSYRAAFALFLMCHLLFISSFLFLSALWSCKPSAFITLGCYRGSILSSIGNDHRFLYSNRHPCHRQGATPHDVPPFLSIALQALMPFVLSAQLRMRSRPSMCRSCLQLVPIARLALTVPSSWRH